MSPFEGSVVADLSFLEASHIRDSVYLSQYLSFLDNESVWVTRRDFPAFSPTNPSMAASTIATARF